MKNKLFYIILSVSIIITSLTVDFNASQAAQTAVKQTKPAAVKTEPAITVAPSEVVKNPSKYLNKNITFSANFVSFTTLGLDYKPAFRDSSKYIGVLIQCYTAFRDENSGSERQCGKIC